MKKITTIITVIITLLLLGCSKKEIKPFLLTSKYYESSEFIEIDKDNLNNLINEKENFAIFIYQPMCEASSTFNDVLTEFMNTYKISINKIEYKNIKETSLKKYIKYYPSLVIYKDGKIIDYLEADKDEDTKKFKNMDDFINWFSKYVIINQDEENLTKIDENTNNNDIQNDKTALNDNKQNNSNQNKKENNKNNETTTNNKTETNKIETPKEPSIFLQNVNYNENKVNIYLFWGDGCPHCENKVNIYLFWGDGCPHCENAKSFFEEMNSKYGEYYNLHMYEVWHNQDNEKILKLFADKMGDDVSGVPYIIIGNKTFKGFGESYKEDITNAITSQHKNSYDVYFDLKN